MQNEPSYSFSALAARFHNWLDAAIESDFILQVTELIITGVLLLVFLVLLCFFLGYMERKVAAFMEIRLGPNRVGPKGSLQIIADTIKLLFKEGLTPNQADKFLFNLAPAIMVITALLAIAPLAFAKNFQIWDLNIGLLYVSSISSMAVIGVLMAGWSSSNKYSLIGAMRCGAQIVSYELSVGLSLISIVVLAGSMQISEIVESQANGWWIFKGHIPVLIAFVIFIIASTAEINRAPFDLTEAEQELTGGFHTEYSGMKFAMFLLSEYINLFIVSAIAATIFLGGWMPFHIGGLDGFNHAMDYIPSSIWFFGKTFLIIFIIMWFRWTFPRLRIDQLLNLEWKYLLPISMINILLITAMTIFGWHF
ncbi:MAG: NADH-quinone oxidoreductase subunit NuoH [Crocinitomicaceae bacterium]|nr:NADH-quinone oxidoreductase subunit NuoH [Crocinitomicaceae bacterium]MBK8926990.1 NADH-quinone oxidoreductase subunit NuoH [Crocinitomicaceae bacterium]